MLKISKQPSYRCIQRFCLNIESTEYIERIRPRVKIHVYYWQF